MIDRNFYSIAEIFQVRMKDMGITNRAMAKKLKVNEGHMSRMISGKAVTTRAQYLYLCDVLDFDPVELRDKFPDDLDGRGGLRAVGSPALYIHSRNRK